MKMTLILILILILTLKQACNLVVFDIENCSISLVFTLEIFIGPFL